MAGITTPFINPQFPFIQTVSQQSLDGIAPAFALADGPAVAPLAATPDAGLGQGVFTVNRDRGSGYAEQWNVAWQRELPANLTLEVAYTGSRITRLGVPNRNLNQLRVEQLALGRPFSSRSRIRSRGRSRPRRRSAAPCSRARSSSSRIPGSRR